MTKLRGKIITISTTQVLSAYACRLCSLITSDAEGPRMCPRCYHLMKPIYKQVMKQVAV